MKIAIGCDHGGFELKEAVRGYLEERQIPYEDFGAYNTDSVDYAPIAAKAARAVAAGQADFGVLVCSTGIGISMAANKVKGIRAALCTNEFCAEMTRRHNNANILCMGGKVIDKETAVKLVDIFLHTEFEGAATSGASTKSPRLRKAPFKDYQIGRNKSCSNMRMFSSWTTRSSSTSSPFCGMCPPAPRISGSWSARLPR